MERARRRFEAKGGVVLEFTSIDGVSVRPDGVALATSPSTPPGGPAKDDGGPAGRVRACVFLMSKLWIFKISRWSCWCRCFSLCCVVAVVARAAAAVSAVFGCIKLQPLLLLSFSPSSKRLRVAGHGTCVYVCTSPHKSFTLHRSGQWQNLFPSNGRTRRSSTYHGILTRHPFISAATCMHVSPHACVCPLRSADGCR